ncbi:hypothetical protein [Clostridium botulinum]|uniref:hypothetical protein n=1 Tax=Clostridium botulinum TaxID=1491 RepID=UPI00059E735E|nr:hypothetical protein [Clostridium botulinum]KIN80956.1 hypothetical protein SD74_13280 [Clostridium botulinum]MBE1304552.1 hypothetical protein [Clostridium botulinum]MCC5425786.1 hypothetical protein [Clostridium botulinum]MCC5437724.1 hypothetical protein [Clostridium botulinum]
MNIPYIIIVILCIMVVFSSIKLDKSRQKQIDYIQKEFKGLLSFVESLKFRVYDHEKQLLNREGVFVPEDTGIFTFNLMWGMLDEETKKNLQEEYDNVCPSHIPLWKYVLYSHKFTPKIERKIELRKIESVDDLLNSVTKDTDKLLKDVKSKLNKVNELQNKSEEIPTKLSETKNIVDDKKGS